MNNIKSSNELEVKLFSELPDGWCFDVSTKGPYGYCLMKLIGHRSVSLINGYVNDLPADYDPQVYPAPVGTVVTIEVGTRER